MTLVEFCVAVAYFGTTVAQTGNKLSCSRLGASQPMLGTRQGLIFDLQLRHLNPMQFALLGAPDLEGAKYRTNNGWYGNFSSHP